MLEGAAKYVATTTLHEPPAYANTTLLHGDVADEVARLKAQVDGVLAIMGSGRLIETLLPRQLVDELLLFVNPCVLGSGRRLFPDGSPLAWYRCRQAVTTPGGLLVATYSRPDEDG